MNAAGWAPNLLPGGKECHCFFGFEQLNNNTERGIAGTMGVVLAVYGAGWGLAAGAALYILVERTHLLKFTSVKDKQAETIDAD